MDSPEKFIANSDQLTNIFGYWPSFHDAEIIKFDLWRGDVQPEAGRYIFPVLTTQIHLWEITPEVDDRGYLILRHRTLATLRFHDVDSISMQGFNHQNAIFGLHFSTEDGGEGLPPWICVEFKPAFGISAKFRCCRVELLSAEPYAKLEPPNPAIHRTAPRADG
jgi:hypothetical protein